MPEFLSNLKIAKFSGNCKISYTPRNFFNTKTKPTEQSVFIENGKISKNAGMTSETMCNLNSFFRYIGSLDGKEEVSNEDLALLKKAYVNEKDAQGVYKGFITNVRYDSNAGVQTIVTKFGTIRVDFETVKEMQPGKDAVNIIKSSESCELEAYRCPAGKWTIGYGHTGKVNGKKITEGMTITPKEAEKYLQEDINEAARIVKKYVKVYLNQRQFDALVSFVFNLGEENFKTSTLLEKINDGKNAKEIGLELLRWVHSNGKVLEGLKTRRKIEYTIYTGQNPPKDYEFV